MGKILYRPILFTNMSPIKISYLIHTNQKRSHFGQKIWAIFGQKWCLTFSLITMMKIKKIHSHHAKPCRYMDSFQFFGQKYAQILPKKLGTILNWICSIVWIKLKLGLGIKTVFMFPACKFFIHEREKLLHLEERWIF